MALRIGELVGVLRADASAWERGLDRAQVRMAGLQRDTAGRLRDMNGRFVTAGQQSGQGFARSALRTMGQRMRRGLASTMRGAFSAVQGIGSVVTSSPFVKGIGAAVAAGVVAVMLPAIGALLAASVISVAGLGVIGVAAMLLKEKPAVKKAAKSLKTTVMDGLKDAAAPLEDEFVAAIKSVEQTFKDIQPALEKVFKAVEPLIKPVTDGFNKLVKNLLPGFTKMMEDAKPVFEGLESFLADIGKGLSGFFKEIGKSAPEAGQFLKDLGRFLKEALIWGGMFIGWLSRVYMKVRPALKYIWDLCKGFRDAFQWLYDVLVGNSIIPDMVNAIVEWIVGLPGKVLGKLGDFVGKVIRKFGQMKDRVVARVRSFVNTAVSWIRGLPGRAWDALRDFGSKVAARAWDAGRRLVSAVRNKVGDAVRYVRGLPGRAARALSGLGSRLYSSGRSLIAGFVRGIWSKIGDVANAAASVVSRARDFFPFSPAKEGPFSGKGWTLYSGQALIDGFRQGIGRGLPGLRRELGGLGAGMPAFTSGAVALAGAGAAAGRGGGGGAMVVHVHMGGREFGRLWVDTGREQIKVLGGDVQAAIGQRGARR